MRLSRVHGARLGDLRILKPMNDLPASFKGNKQQLPSKPCVACGRPMSWRKRWARSWDTVKFCSERCRRAPNAHG